MICENSGATVDDLQGIDDANPSSNLFTELENENTTARLKTNPYDIKRDINRRHSLFIRIIPSEIIATISGFANTDFSITGSLLILLSVCSDWRRAVVGSPELWTSIKIDLPPTSQNSNDSFKLPRLATFIDEWLARAGQLPLNITLCSVHDIPWPGDSAKEYLPIFKILNKYSSRWHSFNISIPAMLHQLLQPDCLPLLEQLRITCKSNEKNITFPPTPSLNTVEIHPVMNSDYQNYPKIGIHWNTVTHVFLETIMSCHCFMLLRLNPQLVHCTFHKVIDDDDGDIEEFHPPIHSSLTYLSLHHRRSYLSVQHGTSQILDNVTLPYLKTLVMFNVIFEPIMAFIYRSGCSLDTLSLLNWHKRKTNKLTELLELLSPSLKRLSISRLPSPIRGTKNYLTLLTKTYASQTQSEVVGNDFLPHLEVFEYREEYTSTLETSMLSTSRNSPKPANTSISLRLAYISKATIINKEVPPAISVILQRLEEDGILIYT